MAEYISREELRKHLKECYDNELFDADMRKATIGIDVYVENMPVADVQPVSQWISVKDRLPETGKSVLVYVAINKNLKGFGECKPEIRIGWLDDGDKWALQFSNMDYSEVLYWLPLPELPKDGDTNG